MTATPGQRNIKKTFVSNTPPFEIPQYRRTAVFGNIISVKVSKHRQDGLSGDSHMYAKHIFSTMQRMRRGNASDHVCLCVCTDRALTLVILDLGTSFLICRHNLRLSGSRSSIKVIGSRPRSQK